MTFKNLFVCLALVLVAAQAKLQLSFYGDNASPKVLKSDATANSEWVAQAEYSPASEHISNFGQFTVKTNSIYGDNAQTFAAGFLEGYLTAETIHQHYSNMMCQVDCSGAVPPELKEFFSQQDAWTRLQVQKNPDSPYWNYVGKWDRFTDRSSSSNPHEFTCTHNNTQRQPCQSVRRPGRWLQRIAAGCDEPPASMGVHDDQRDG